MRTLLLAFILAFLKAQLPPLPDTLWRGVMRMGTGDWTEYRLWRSRSSPIVSETWRRTGPSTWELNQRDTLLLDGLGKIQRYVFKDYYTNNQNQPDSLVYQVLFTYPTSTRTRMEIHSWDRNRLAWQPVTLIEWTAPSQDARDVLESFVGPLMGIDSYLYPGPRVYKRAHVGDTARYYKWDALANPPGWTYIGSYALKTSGPCDTLVDPSTGTSSDIALCFDSQGRLQLARDTSTSDTSVKYRMVFYDATGRVVKDSTERFDYDVQGNLSYHSRHITTFTYDNQGRLSEVQELNIHRQGGPINRRLERKRLHSGFYPLREAQFTQADTTLLYWRYVYSTASSVEGIFQSGCFKYAMPQREGYFGCLVPTARVSLSLYDLTGRLLWRGEVTGTQPTFRLPETLPSGVYLLRAGDSTLRLYLAP